MSITRREFIGGACAAGAAAALSTPGGDVLGMSPARRPEEFSFVHLTDMHVTHKRKGDQGYRACIESVRALKCKPRFALMGGDLGFDGNYSSKADFAEYIRLYKEISDGLGFPYYNCMGNHDVLGWSPRRKVDVNDPDIGKKMIMDRLNWGEKSYYSFDYGGWHFVMLDSIYPVQSKDGPVYEPRIGREQLEWLAYDLGAAGGRPTVAVTHMAAFCNVGQIAGDPNHKAMDGNMVLWDTRELRTILERHKVKALLQGHSHDIEEYYYHGVWYLTSASAGGAWWAGDWVGSPQGYTVFHCKGEELTWEHVTFPWTPQLEPQDTLERKKIEEQRAFREEQQRLLERERAGKRD
jgi:3',5'-cyclic AMP phosphodiesterase CpdA